MMAALAPGWTPRHLADLADVTVGVAWTERADETVRASVRRTAARLPRRRSLTFPFPEFSPAGFMSEVADTHRELFAAHRDEYARMSARRCGPAWRSHATRPRLARRARALPAAGARRAGRRRPAADPDAADPRARRRGVRPGDPRVDDADDAWVQRARLARDRAAVPIGESCRRRCSSSAVPETTRSCSPPHGYSSWRSHHPEPAPSARITSAATRLSPHTSSNPS